MGKQRFSVEYKYEVHFTEKIFDISNQLFAKIIKKDSQRLPIKMAMAIDSGVLAHHGNILQDINQYCQVNRELTLVESPLILPGGELAKNDVKYLFELLDFIDRAKLDRHCYLVAIGGGAILDLVGLAAAIAHRGIRHIRVPTTVLSQNDSGIGVKNGINYKGKKNFIGTFAPPHAVFNDGNFLTSLSDRDWRSGIPEAIKVSLLKDASFFKWLSLNSNRLVERDTHLMKQLIERCALLHLNHIVTNGDPFEFGSSRPLDFGHWAAHKLEQMTQFEIRHGEAVAIGLAMDITYSWMKGLLSVEIFQHIFNSLKGFGFSLYHDQLTDPSGQKINPLLLAGLEEFREHLGGELTIMLIEDIGKPLEVNEMDKALIEKSVLYLKNNC